MNPSRAAKTAALQRRTLLLGAASTLAPAAWSQTPVYPNRPVQLIVAAPPGGPSDVLARQRGGEREAGGAGADTVSGLNGDDLLPMQVIAAAFVIVNVAPVIATLLAFWVDMVPKPETCVFVIAIGVEAAAVS